MTRACASNIPTASRKCRRSPRDAIVTAKSRNASAWLSAFDMGAACFEDSPLFAAKIMSNPRSVNRNRNHRPELIRRMRESRQFASEGVVHGCDLPGLLLGVRCDDGDLARTLFRLAPAADNDLGRSNPPRRKAC
jgi:hypothetical protein